MAIMMTGRSRDSHSGTAYSWNMENRADEMAAILGLLKLKGRGESWGSIASDITMAGSAIALAQDRFHDGLIPSPEVERVLDESRRLVDSWEENGLSYVTVLDDSYPERLRDIREMTPFLFYSGNLKRIDSGMSIVGSRNAPRRSRELAAEIARYLVTLNLTVISGLAEGIDAAAHSAALDAHGRTVAFIGTGIDKYFPPANTTLQEQISAYGLVLSQFYPQTAPTKQTFPMRNALMSGYGLATIVVDAGEHSGTRIQARLAGEHGRPVILTSRVAETTSWGRALHGEPNVYVAETLGDLKEAVRDVMTSSERLARAMEELTAL